MDKIKVSLFGKPIVIINDEQIHFPYKKAECLFYHVCINKTITREEAVNILWTDSDENTAKKNLRDALYKIKKVLGENIFLDTKKSIISLNQDIVEIDYDNINSENIIENYHGEFLENFYIKDSFEFEEWAEKIRLNFKKIYLSKIEDAKISALKNMDNDNASKLLEIIINQDPYNEDAYAELMKIYAYNGLYNNALKLYNSLKNLLLNELNVSPGKDIQTIYETILDLKSSNLTNFESNNYFFGRFDEILRIKKLISIFNANPKKAISIAIIGEAGIGKTTLLDKILLSCDENQYIILKTACYQAEKNFFMRPWLNILNSNENEVIINKLSTMAQKKRVILAFDDIQWMDEKSLVLLSIIIQKLSNHGIMMICTYRDDFTDYISKFTIPLMSKELLTEIKLKRFSKNEVKQIADDNIIAKMKNQISYETIFAETEGNALFLTELIKAINEKGYTKELSLKAESIIKTRIIDLSSEEKNVLNTLSIFFDYADINILKFILEYSELKICDALEKLCSKKLIDELNINNNIYYSFTHQKIREYVYNQQSFSKRMIMHKKAYDYLKTNSNFNDFTSYPRIIYHLEKSKDKINELKYKAKYFKEYYAKYHELFPVTNYIFDNDSLNFDSEIEKKQITELYDEINMLNISNSNMELKDLLLLKAEIAYIAGRFLIAHGEYEKGLKYIKESIKNSEIINSSEYLLLNYNQMIFYCIQINDLDMMKLYIDKSLELINIDTISEKVGTILRLYGLYCINTNNEKKAYDLLNKALDIFQTLNLGTSKYSVSIAACYNYLAKLYKNTKNYDKAYEYLIKAINICNFANTSNGLGIFYTNLGQLLYENRNIEDANKYMTLAIENFKKNNSLWGRDTAEIYKALIEIDNHNFELAKKHYKMAKEISTKLSNPSVKKLIKEAENKLF